MNGGLRNKVSAMLSKNFIGIKMLSDETKIELLQHSEEYNLDSNEIEDIIISIKDHDKVANLIISNELMLDGHNIMNIVDLMEDDKITWEIINNFEKCNLNVNQRHILLDKIKDDAYNKEIINNWEKFGLMPQDVEEKILAMSNDQFKREFIHNIDSYNLTNDKEIVSEAIVEIACSMKNDNLKKDVLNHAEQYSLNSLQKINILREIKDDAYKRQILDNYHSLGYGKNDVAGIISTIADDDYKKTVINNTQQYGFSASEIAVIAMSLNDDKYKKNIIKNLSNSKNPHQQSINLPKEMTIGMEIESEGANSLFVEKQKLAKGWSAKSDSSLSFGVEVVSPILKPGNDAVEDIYQVCNTLSLCGQKISDRCGGHIHIGANYLDDVESLKTFVEICANTEKLLYIIGNEKGTIPREGTSQYSAPISRRVEQAIQKGSVSFDTIEDIDAFANEMNKIQGSQDRYVGINFQNLGFDKNTIEFRLPNGSVNPDTWIENINLFGGIVKASKIISEIQKKDVYQVTNDEKKMLDSFEKLSQDNISEEEKLDCLLDLTVGNEKQIYVDRYNENKELMKGTQVNEQIQDQIQQKPVKITKKEEEKLNAINEGFATLDSLAEQRMINTGQGMEVNDAKSR